MPFGNDGDFSDTAFQNRVNSNLANEVGNLAMRTLSMAVKNCEGRVPLPVGAEGEGPIADRKTLSLSAEDEGLLKSAGGCLDIVRPLVGETQQLHKALDAILQVQLEMMPPEREKKEAFVQRCGYDTFSEFLCCCSSTNRRTLCHVKFAMHCG